MEKFRYRKEKHAAQDGVVVQNNFGELFLQTDYNSHTDYNSEHVVIDYDQDQHFERAQRLHNDQQFDLDQRLHNGQQFGLDQRLQNHEQFGLDERLHNDQQFGLDQRLQNHEQFGLDQRLLNEQQFGLDQKRLLNEQQFGLDQKRLLNEQQFGLDQKRLLNEQQFSKNRTHMDKPNGHIKKHGLDQIVASGRRPQDNKTDPDLNPPDELQFSVTKKQRTHQLVNNQRQHQSQQHLNNNNSDHKQLPVNHNNNNNNREKQQQYVPARRPREDPQDAVAAQRSLKQLTDWNGVMQDLFGMELPQTAESTHESTSSGIASDVTSVYPSTPTLTTFKGGDSAESASSVKSTFSRDSGTKSVSASGSPRPDQIFEKLPPRSVRTNLTIPRNGPPILGKNNQRIASPSSQNRPRQVNQSLNGFSQSPVGFTTEKTLPRDRRHRRPEPNCFECSNNVNVRPYSHHTDSPSSFSDCRAVDPSFCCEFDQRLVDSRNKDYFIDPCREDRLTKYHPKEKSASRDRLHRVSPPVCPTISPVFCCSQANHQNGHDFYLLSENAPQNLQPWNKHQQRHHNHQLQQHPPPQVRYSPSDSDNINHKSNSDICNNHNHHNLPQAPQPNGTSSPILQTFKSSTSKKPSCTSYHCQPSKPAVHSLHETTERPPQTVLQSPAPRESHISVTHAQIHTPSPQPRSRNEIKTRPDYIRTESPIHKPQFDKDADLSRYLLTGINNLSLSQKDNVKGKITQVPSSCKRLTSKISPFEYLPNDVLLKIFGHLSTDHLCRCAQVCHHWYNAVWDNPILWTTIVINNPNINVDRALKYLTRRLSYNTPKVCMILEKININTCCRLSDRGLQTVAKRCPELRYLDMQGCHLITNLGVKEAVSRCVNLERLDVTDCPLVTCLSLMDSLIAQSASRHLQRIYLRYLDMTDCPNVTDEDLCITTSQCTQLLFLYLRRCPLITDLGVTYIANNCCSLRELSLSDCKNVTDLGMRELAKLCDNLRYLSVAKCEKVSDQGVIHIARNCSKLRYLNVRGCEAFSDTGLDFLARNCPRLRSLDIGKCDITDDGLYALSMHCPNLRKLGMKSCDSITDKGIVLIAYRCTYLQQLHVQDCCLSPEAYAMVRKYCKRAIIEHTNPAIL